MKTAVLMLVALAMACAACGGGAQDFTEQCMSNGSTGVAQHDFGTTDPSVLGRVTAYQNVTSNKDCSFSGTGAGDEPIFFNGSVARVVCCNASNTVTFILEP